jgi:putative transposase
MGLRYPDQKNHVCFFATTSFMNRKPYGKYPGLYEEMAKSIDFCQKKYYAAIAGYVLMPSHLHLLMFIDGQELSNFMRDFKKYISQKVKQDLDINASNLWMPRFDRVVIESRDIFLVKLEYIHNNPVKAGYVIQSEDWKWSSAGDYFTDKSGPIHVWKDW